MPGKLVKTPHDALTYKIIGDAMAVHRERGPGYREDTYQRDLEAHFANSGLAYVAQKNIEVYDSLDENVLVGYYIPDFIVEESVVVEIKALSGGLDNSHIAQVIGYLAVTGCPPGCWSTSAHAACNGSAFSHQKTSPHIGSIVSGYSSLIDSRQSEVNSCRRITVNGLGERIERIRCSVDRLSIRFSPKTH
jgi:GxxExxY protein